MSRFRFGRATKLVAVMALVGAPTFALVSSATPAGAASTVGTENAFRTAFANTSETLVTLTANINLTCGGGGYGSGGEADRGDGSDVTIDGAGFTITQTCGGDRVLDNGSGKLTLKSVTVTGGSPVDDGGGVWSDGSVALDAATVTHNSAWDCFGGGVYVSSGDLTMSNASVVSNNFSDCSGGGVYVDSGNLTVRSGSSIINNQATDGRGGFAANQVTVTDSTVSGNQANDGEGGGGEAWDGITVTNSTFANNSSTSEGGGFESEGSTVVTNSHIVNNKTNDDGGGFNNDGGSNDTITVTDSTVAGNVAGGDGGGFDLNDGNAVTVVRSTLANNASSDESGGALSIESENTVALAITNSTVTGNSQVFDGAIDASNSDVSTVLTHDSISNNSVTASSATALASEGTAKKQSKTEHVDGPKAAERSVRGQQQQNEPASIRANGDISSFGTLIVQPQGGPNCALDTTMNSLGYNFSDDGSGNSCGFDGSTDTHLSTNDAMLGALGDNGGPTQTLLPANASPVIDAIPVKSCDPDITTDQRGVTRPQIKGCDIGAVEVRGASVDVTKVVTGASGTVPSAGYSFKVTCSDGTSGTLTVADATAGGTSATLGNIRPGSTCTTVEAPVVYTNSVTTQPKVTYDPTVTPALAEGGTGTVTVTNNYEGIDLLGLVVVIQPKFTG